MFRQQAMPPKITHIMRYPKLEWKLEDKGNYACVVLSIERNINKKDMKARQSLVVAPRYNQPYPHLPYCSNSMLLESLIFDVCGTGKEGDEKINMKFPRTLCVVKTIFEEEKVSRHSLAEICKAQHHSTNSSKPGSLMCLLP